MRGINRLFQTLKIYSTTISLREDSYGFLEQTQHGPRAKGCTCLVHIIRTSLGLPNPDSYSHYLRNRPGFMLTVKILSRLSSYIHTSSTASSNKTHLWKRRGERMYSSYSFTTTALDGDEWSASRPGHALPPGKEPSVTIAQEAA
jgi:hypothetical protein